ncbi:MAG TPA: hypothetical protein PLU72_11405 [Candidatus Ozemobacteraceae bacterium]|nr:hypothetical protein [Candidatus Ozemobacteraceae bacterium]HQG28106.1 hypothetical protein [Candidatus Ozemobacteraceae bacterium]
MGDESRERAGERVFSADLLRRVPQKLFLSEREYPSWLPFGLAFLTILTTAAWCAIAERFGWGMGASIVGSLAALLSGYAVWLLVRWFLIPVLRARGFYPVVEYLPEESKVVIYDRPGRSLWGEEHAVVTVFLDSMTGVVLERTVSDWVVSIRLKKGDALRILSSTRHDREKARELASDLAAMLSLPWSDDAEHGT